MAKSVGWVDYALGIYFGLATLVYNYKEICISSFFLDYMLFQIVIYIYLWSKDSFDKPTVYLKYIWINDVRIKQGRNPSPFFASKQPLICTYNLQKGNFFLTVFTIILNFSLKKIENRYHALHLPPRFWN